MTTSSAAPRTAPDTTSGAALAAPTTVALVRLGCARNDVDAEELAGRLEAGGFALVEDPADAEAVVVNTCGFVEQAKKDSVDTLLAAADLKEDGRTRAVVAVGCLAERYGEELAESLPEADAVLGFDAYPNVAARLRGILDGERPSSHTPTDRRLLLPISPVERTDAQAYQPGHEVDAGAFGGRKRLDDAPWASLKLASGCDRQCSFCAIPSFRGSFVSRRPTDVVAEARWLAGQGVREVFCVSENSTSYGKDLGDLRLLESLLPELASVPGIQRVRASYLQPAEMRPGLVQVIGATEGVAAYYDLSFQHASGPVLRRMRRFGDAEQFLGLLERARAVAPRAGARSNFIVGFPGETEADLEVLCDFLSAARLDAIGVFGYSDEDGTEAEAFADKLDPDEVAARTAHVSELVEELVAQRAEERLGEVVEVLVERIEDGPGGAGDREIEGRAEHQGPEVDGTTTLRPAPGGTLEGVRVGDMIRATVVATEGVDLVAEARGAW